MSRFVVDCDTLLRIAAGEVDVDRDLARAVSLLVATATVDALRAG
jgi:hypothetical protein